MLDFSTTPITPDILIATQLGTWSYRFGESEIISDSFYGYWEVIRKIPKTTAKIVSISKQHGMKVIIQSYIATYKLSPSRNRNSISWFAASFLVRLVDCLYQYGEEKIFSKYQNNNYSIKNGLQALLR